MRTQVDSRLRREAKEYKLRFTCAYCAHYDDLNNRCAEGYPNEEHLDDSLIKSELLFCKLFEGA